MKLTSFRDRDRVHVRDLIDVGLVDAGWLKDLPPALAELPPSHLRARAHDYLKTNGMLIAANDLWIAATALAHGLRLVTRNTQHFRRVPRLEVMEYPGPSG